MGGGRSYGEPLAEQGLLDGEALLRFTQLPCSMQARLAAAAGSDRSSALQAAQFCQASWA